MCDGFVTKRSLQNDVTGIDMHVPLYNEVRGSMMTGHVEYQIIVVTRLAAFKSLKHKQEDTIQLLVSKKYSEFHEFYNRLSALYSSISLPAIPRKVLFVSEADLCERRLAFDALVKFISKDSTLASCPELLEFLGAKINGYDFSNRNVATEEDSENNEVSFFHRDVTSTGVAREEGSETTPETTPDPNPNPTPETTPDPNADKDSTELHYIKKHSQEIWLPEGNSSVVSLQEPKPGTSLLPPAGASAGCGVDYDADELLRVEDDFDKLLQIKKCIKNEPTSVPKTNPKPALLKSATSSGVQTLFVDQLKNQMDVLKYIQENELTAANDLELF